MPNLRCTEGDHSGQEPEDRLNKLQTGNQRIPPPFTFLEDKKAAIIAVFNPITGHRKVSIFTGSEKGGEDGERR